MGGAGGLCHARGAIDYQVGAAKKRPCLRATNAQPGTPGVNDVESAVALIVGRSLSTFRMRQAAPRPRAIAPAAPLSPGVRAVLSSRTKAAASTLPPLPWIHARGQGPRPTAIAREADRRGQLHSPDPGETHFPPRLTVSASPIGAELSDDREREAERGNELSLEHKTWHRKRSVRLPDVHHQLINSFENSGTFGAFRLFTCFPLQWVRSSRVIFNASTLFIGSFNMHLSIESTGERRHTTKTHI